MDPLIITLIATVSFNVALLVFMVVTQISMNTERRDWSKEREMLVKANMARDLTELTVSETMKSESETSTEEETQIDLIPVEDADDKLFDELVLGEKSE